LHTFWFPININSIIKKLNKKIKVFKRQILLLIDYAGGHTITDEAEKKFTHVKLEYFGPAFRYGYYSIF
jgi:hypothetical protein